MGYYTKKRNIRKFWENPLVNLCYTLSVIAFVAGLFGICAVLGGANALVFALIMLAAGVLLIVLGKKLNERKKKQQAEPPTAE